MLRSVATSLANTQQKQDQWTNDGLMLVYCRALPIYHYSLGSVLEKLGDQAVNIPSYAKMI